jgi:hypothetical protein
MTMQILRGAGITEGPDYHIHGRSVIVSKDDGKTVALVLDPNQSGSIHGDGTGVTKLYVYEATNLFNATWSLAATLTLAQNMRVNSTNDTPYCASIGSTNKIHMVYLDSSNNLRMLILNASTYAVDTNEVALAAASLPTGGAWIAIDMSITDTPQTDADSVLLAVQWTSTGSIKIGHTVMMRRPSDNTWQIVVNVNDNATAIEQPNAYGMIAVTWINGPTTDATMKFAVAWSVVTTASDVGYSVPIYTVNGQSGTVATLAAASPTWPAGIGGGYFSPATETSTDPKRRILDLFCDGPNTFVFAVAEGKIATQQGRFIIVRMSISGAVGATYTQAINSGWTLPQYFSFGHNDAGYTIIGCHYISESTVLATYVARMSGNVLYWTGGYRFTTDEASSYDWVAFPKIMVNPDSSNWLHHHEHEAFALVNDGESTTSRSFVAIPATANIMSPQALVPAGGSTVTTSEPTLQSTVVLGDEQQQSKWKLEFQLDPTAGFNTNLRTVVQPDSKLFFSGLNNPANPTPAFTYSEVVSPAQALVQGNWYMRSRILDEFGNKGPWNTLGSTFAVSHPPVVTPVSPIGGVIVPWISGNTIFDYDFSDPYYSDSQTQLQIEVQRVDTSAVVVNSGWVISTDSSWQGAIGAGYKDIPLKWKVKAKDEDGVESAWSGFATFTLVDPPSIVINSPVSGVDVTSPQVAANFTPTVGGSRTIVAYRIQVSQSGVLIFDSNTVAITPVASGTPIAYNSGVSLYENNNNYTMTITITDSAGLLGGASVSFPTAWVPPAAAAGVALSTTHFNVENEGYLSLTWNDVNRDTDFFLWRVYRRLSEVNEAFAVIEVGEWEPVYDEYITAATYEYRDYFAPAGKQAEYRVEQVVNRFGDLLESETVTVVAAVPASDGYWLIEPLGPDGTADAFRISIVTGDSYSDEYEEAEFTVIGRGRYVDRGDALGVKGQLDCQFRNTGGTTARQKKRRLETLKRENRNLYLRTPFGDVYRVSVSNISVSRIAGVGQSEFVDVGIPYSEVAE